MRAPRRGNFDLGQARRAALALVVFRVRRNTRASLRRLISELLSTLETARAGAVTFVTERAS